MDQKARAVPLADRFWSKVDKDGPVQPHVPHLGKCWVWTGSISRGYGSIVVDKSVRRSPSMAHRVSYELCIGDPADIQVLHRCDHRPCVRPEHLFIGTQQDNMDDASRKGRIAHGTMQPLAKLTDAAAAEIKVKLAVGGYSRRALAEEYGVSPGLIRLIKTGRSWGHVACPDPFRRAA